jgi:RNA 2',3'-cyclic 3'-phosphodiesterase
MRLFIAIDFDKNIKTYFEHIKIKLENYCIKGRFTNIENFHITLIFIGELEESDVPKVLKTMEDAVSVYDTFNLTLDKLGSFNKGNANILWIGTIYNDKLVEIHKKLCFSLKHEGMPFDEKPLKPHITLGRQVILRNEINELVNLISIDKLTIPVSNITLMESKRINDKLTYVPLAIFNLKN